MRPSLLPRRLGARGGNGATRRFFWKIAYPPQITVGEKVSLPVYVVTEDPTYLHIAMRGRFQTPPNHWDGHWTYKEQTMPVGAGTHTINIPFTIPGALYVEKEMAPKFQAQNYYFYVFACPPGRDLGPEVPQQAGGAKGPWTNYNPNAADQVVYPELDRRRLPAAAIRVLRDRVQLSDVREEVRRSLLARLKNAGKLTHKAYKERSFQPLNTAVAIMERVVNELRSCSEALYSPKTQECIDLSNFTILWMIEAMRT